MRPMLATKGSHVPAGAEWWHEVKWDGMRVLVEVTDGAVRLFSRNENDVTVTFPEVQGLPGRDLLLDGEIVAFADGLPTFGALADRMHVRSATRAAALAQSNPVTLLVFDMLRVDGRDLTGLPLEERRQVLLSLDLHDDRWQTPPTYDDGAMLLEATRQQGLEGVISKRRSSRYDPGARSKHWLKFPHRAPTSWVVGGWRPETGSEHRLGALLVGEPTPTGRALPRSGRQRDRRQGAVRCCSTCWPGTAGPTARSPTRCRGSMRSAPAGSTRVLVVDVESLGVSAPGRLRQPSYRGVRPDLGPARTWQRGPTMSEVRVDVDGPHADDQQPRQGALPAHRHHQG